MALKHVVEAMEFSAPILDAKNWSLGELKESAKDQLLDYLKAHKWLLFREPAFRVEHGAEPVLHVKAQVVKAVRI